MKQNLQEIIEKFSVDGEFVSATPCGNGHINDTFSVRMNINGKMLHYLVQSVNLYVFPEVEKLMENMMRVTDHVYKILKDIPGADPERETRRIIPTVDGFPGFVDEKNHYWRVFTFIENAYTIDVVESPHQAYQAAKAFGTFQKYLRDLPGTRLFDTIPDFHHTPKRYQALEKAIDNCQSNRLELAKKELEFAVSRKDITSVVVDKLADGTIPERITHNDTKINNVMFDENSEHAICVIDLDTIMPGSILYDFGDQIRTTTSTGSEDEKDLSKIVFLPEMFEALVHGYLEAAGSFLVKEEIKLLAFSGKLITFEIGLRFLTDYLDGDKYFKTDHEHHNLDRCRTQFELVRQIEAHYDEMQEIVKKYARRLIAPSQLQD